MEYRIRRNGDEILAHGWDTLERVENWINKLIGFYPTTSYEVVVEVQRYIIWQNHRLDRPSIFVTLEEAREMNLL